MSLLVLNLQNVAETPSVVQNDRNGHLSTRQFSIQQLPELQPRGCLDLTKRRHGDDDMWHVTWWRVISVIPDTFTMITLSESALFSWAHLLLFCCSQSRSQVVHLLSHTSASCWDGFWWERSFLICKMILKNVHWGKNVPTLWQILQFRLVSFRSKHLLNESVFELPGSMQIEHFQADPC